MTLDQAAEKHQGSWGEDNLFRILGPDGYIWIVATRVGGEVAVTSDGKRFGIDVAQSGKNVVNSTGKKGKKSAPEPVVVPEDQPDPVPTTLEELDI